MSLNKFGDLVIQMNECTVYVYVYVMYVIYVCVVCVRVCARMHACMGACLCTLCLSQ